MLLGDVAGHKDVVVALLGASAGLAGFALVFYGLVVAGYQSLPTTSSGDVKKPWQDAIHLILASFVMGLVCSAFAVMWLVNLHDNRAIYLLSVLAFVLQLGLLGFAVMRSVRTLA